MHENGNHLCLGDERTQNDTEHTMMTLFWKYIHLVKDEKKFRKL